MKWKTSFLVIGLCFSFTAGAFSEWPSPQLLACDTIPAEQMDTTERKFLRIVKHLALEEPTYIFKSRRYQNREGIKTLSEAVRHSGAFGALSIRASQFKGESIVLIGLRGGWINNRSLALGLEGHGIIPSTSYTDILITEEEVTLLGGYAGLFLELIFFSNEVIHITFPVSAGAGWLGYDRRLSNTNLATQGAIVANDVFWYVEPGASLELNVSRNFRMAMGISQRITQGLKLPNTPTGAFQQLNYFLTLKIGEF